MVTRVVCSTETPSIYYYKSRHGVDLIRTGPVNKVFWLQRHLWEVKDLRQSQEYRVRASHCFLSLDNIVFKKTVARKYDPECDREFTSPLWESNSDSAPGLCTIDSRGRARKRGPKDRDLNWTRSRKPSDRRGPSPRPTASGGATWTR